MSEKKYYTIGEIANICDLNPKTLRYYDQIGLIQPEHKNTSTGYRYYTKDQAFSIYMVKKLQLLDFSLQEIKEMLQLNDPILYERAVQKKVDQVNEKIEVLKNIQLEGFMLMEKLSNYRDFVQSFENSAHSNFQPNAKDLKIHIEVIPERPVISTVKTMHDYNNFEISIDRWYEIFNLAEKKHYIPNGSIILTYHTYAPMDQFFKPECKLEAALPVENPKGSSYDKTFGGYTAATTYHYGPYESIPQTHLKILRWIEENGYVVSGYVSEEYLISPFEMQAKEAYLTKIIYPVYKK